MTIRSDGTGLTLVAGGPDYRGAPDWGTGGIVFEEADGVSGARRLVVVLSPPGPAAVSSSPPLRGRTSASRGG